eukprot:CAMPEP_0117442762 /NCGR_PEP_ID=MMETSP0759-20121206/4327_1 /TAXON_ID=63605 /ORGANISM="Percolomonas cosmopolitus, Strain WS" /LENGTH=695 /DNA_ID=CAMNT_0005234677 /DNA_START=212 /DNA_END=2299 /DNA_ORIENTATION=-
MPLSPTHTTLKSLESRLNNAYKAAEVDTDLPNGIYWRGYYLQRKREVTPRSATTPAALRASQQSSRQRDSAFVTNPQTTLNTTTRSSRKRKTMHSNAREMSSIMGNMTPKRPMHFEHSSHTGGILHGQSASSPHAVVKPSSAQPITTMPSLSQKVKLRERNTRTGALEQLARCIEQGSVIHCADDPGVSSTLHTSMDEHTISDVLPLLPLQSHHHTSLDSLEQQCRHHHYPHTASYLSSQSKSSAPLPMPQAPPPPQTHYTAAHLSSSSGGDTTYIPTQRMIGTSKKRLKARPGGPLTQLKKLKSKAYDLKAAAYRQRHYHVTPSGAPIPHENMSSQPPEYHRVAQQSSSPPVTTRNRSKSLVEQLQSTEDMEQWIRKKQLNRMKQPKKLRTKDALEQLTKIEEEVNWHEIETPRAVIVTAAPRDPNPDTPVYSSGDYYDLWRRHEIDRSTGLFIERSASNKFPVIHNPSEISIRETQQRIKQHRERNALRSFVLKRKQELRQHALGIESGEQLLKRSQKMMTLLKKYAKKNLEIAGKSESLAPLHIHADAELSKQKPPPELDPTKSQWLFQHDGQRFALYKMTNDDAQYHMVHIKDTHLRHHLLYQNALHGTTMALDSDMFGDVLPRKPLQRDTAERLIRERATQVDSTLNEDIVEKALNAPPTCKKRGQIRELESRSAADSVESGEFWRSEWS